LIRGVHLLWGHSKLGLIGAQLPIVKSKAEIMFKVEFQTPCRHNRMIFFKKIKLNKFRESNQYSSPKIYLRFRDLNKKS